ncbi:MAG TPA: type VI secretion system-associated protein TagF [Beijerinckiaceae bacterium]|jgi:type VI secretion system protein ImpM|nr:type VI secretion system-associated protein TagF [Beijerinckiaceae bacterium]
MRIGLFGKLQSKRDFIAVSTPRSFLSVWEPWIQSAVATSRLQLDADWQNNFLTAPIWRFWLGRALCGTSVIGAVMSSMDGVGRYFPLTVLGYADEGEDIPPPEINSQDGWFGVVEEFLLWTLESNNAFESVSAALGDLPSPECEIGGRSDRVEIVSGSAAVVKLDGETFDETFAIVRNADHARFYEAATFWWSAGGVGYDPRAFSCARMPDAVVYTSMLTGRFGADATAQPASGSG